MSDHEPNPDPKKTLSEISHLFLSSIRDKQTNGAPRPQRKGPGPQQDAPPKADAKPQAAPRTDISIDLTPEEFAEVYGGAANLGASQAGPAEPASHPVAPVTAVIASHLNGKQFDRVKEYARHLASQFGRVGLIELDASEFRLMCFEPGATPGDLADAAAATAAQPECYDARQIAEAIEELGCDVKRWLVLLTTPRVPEAKALLRQVDHWALLTTCDHDGVVAAYRTLKGLAEPSHPVRRSFRIAEHLVLLCRPTRDKAQMANPPQWSIVGDFLARARAAAPAPVEATADEGVIEATEPSAETVGETMQELDQTIAVEAPTETTAVVGSATPPAASHPATPPTPPAAYDEVLELPDQGATAEAVLSAVLKQNNGTFVECPVRAPMCGEVRLAVGRDRGIVLFAVAREGLGELRSIGQALRWVNENRALLGMALPQFAIDASQSPRLRLLVDQSDLSADVLQPVLRSEYVTVQSYRKLRWGGRTGLLLDAA